MFSELQMYAECTHRKHLITVIKDIIIVMLKIDVPSILYPLRISL